MRTYIDGNRPETLFCRVCLVTLVVPGIAGVDDYHQRVLLCQRLHERQNPHRHPKVEHE